MNPTELPTYPALQKMRAAFPGAAVFVELTQAIYSSGHESNKYRASVVIGSDFWSGESDNAMEAADLCIQDHAARDPKAEAIKEAKATLEAAGYIVKEGEP
jgi:hypothetical protein